MEKQRLLNVYVNNLTMMESVNRIHDMIREKQTSYVVEVNVDVVMKMEKDPYLKKISLIRSEATKIIKSDSSGH